MKKIRLKSAMHMFSQCQKARSVVKKLSSLRKSWTSVIFRMMEGTKVGFC